MVAVLEVSRSSLVETVEGKFYVFVNRMLDATQKKQDFSCYILIFLVVG